MLGRDWQQCLELPTMRMFVHGTRACDQTEGICKKCNLTIARAAALTCFQFGELANDAVSPHLIYNRAGGVSDDPVPGTQLHQFQRPLLPSLLLLLNRKQREADPACDEQQSELLG